MWTCGKCEIINDDSDRFCVVCGTEKAAVVVPAEDTYIRRETLVEQRRYTDTSMNDATKRSDGIKISTDAAVLQEKYDDLTRTANFFKAGIITCVFIAFVLFAQPFLNYYTYYTIYNMALGIIGPIEQVCSLVLLAFAILPAIFILISFDSRKRNLPVTISWVTLFAIVIYCGFIYFGNADHNFVPLMIVLCYSLCVFFATMYVKKLTERENVLFHKGGGALSKEPLHRPETPTREVYHPVERVSEPEKTPQSEPAKSRLKSTMR